MAVIPKGQEPERIKKRMDTLFAKLNEAYPDKIIRSLMKEHKKWGETVTELYKLLGYEDNKSFLEAYGYTYERMAGGRTSNDYFAIIDELKKRYPGGSKFRKTSELQNENPDLSGKIKTLANKANELFGMSLADYFKSIDLLMSTEPKAVAENMKTQKKRSFWTVLIEGEEQPIYCKRASKVSVVEDTHIEMLEPSEGKIVVGVVHKVNDDVLESQLPIPYNNMWKFLRKVDVTKNSQEKIFILSSDGKTIIDYMDPGKQLSDLYIPDGVETIGDTALIKARFKRLHLNKELKYIGQFTLNTQTGKAKSIIQITVDPQNKSFVADERCLYSVLPNQKMMIDVVFKNEDERFVYPEGVISARIGAFDCCKNLKEIELNDECEEFDENIFINSSIVDTIYVGKNVRKIRIIRHCGWNIKRRKYVVDDENQKYLSDGDCLYEVIDDGYLKLLKCHYYGKGNLMIHEKTKVVGAGAFQSCNFSSIEIPDTVEFIECNAFRDGSMKRVVCPKKMHSIEEYAFAGCEKLKQVVLPEAVQFLSKNVFDDTYIGYRFQRELEKIPQRDICDLKQVAYAFCGEYDEQNERVYCNKCIQTTDEIEKLFEKYTTSSEYNKSHNITGKLVKNTRECTGYCYDEYRLYVYSNGEFLGAIYLESNQWTLLEMFEIESINLDHYIPASKRNGDGGILDLCITITKEN